ncbi:MAG TPA: ABC transporter permease, partial [Thermosynergistes sp.]|nr:ABC transporter permease [Thermosynergistes sp.]
MEYVARRLLATVPVLIGVSILIFVMLNIIPGDPVTVMMKERISPDVVEKVKAQMGLDDPLIVRYFRFIGGALRGDFGMSYKLNRPVSRLIMQAFPNTLALALAAA